jgi:alpha-D-ribose 1-methylphosphonate 5-triphosphate synthase subunit PhnH
MIDGGGLGPVQAEEFPPFDPVRGSQQAFRAVMDAMARPGTQRRAAFSGATPPGLPVSAAALIHALCDFETPIWLAPSLAADPAIGAWCTFHTGAPRVAELREAAFVVIDLQKDGLDLAACARGIADYPDRSATILALSPSLVSGARRRIAGPGIKGESVIAVEGLPDDFARQWAMNRAAFPLGVDLVFCCVASITALPRSTRLIGEGD